MKKNLRRAIAVIIVLLIFLIVSALLIRQPWQKEKKVFSVTMPNSTDIVELWEKPFWLFPGITDYKTWFVIRSSDGKENWYLIDAQYITFNKIGVYISSDYSKIRVETTGKTSPSHMIAEYDIKEKTFRAESERSVKDKEGWILLEEKVVR